MSISSQADKHMVCRLVPPKGLAASTISWKRNSGSEVVSASDITECLWMSISFCSYFVLIIFSVVINSNSKGFGVKCLT